MLKLEEETSTEDRERNQDQVGAVFIIGDCIEIKLFMRAIIKRKYFSLVKLYILWRCIWEFFFFFFLMSMKIIFITFNYVYL